MGDRGYIRILNLRSNGDKWLASCKATSDPKKEALIPTQ